jgi:hypothetical protein
VFPKNLNRVVVESDFFLIHPFNLLAGRSRDPIVNAILKAYRKTTDPTMKLALALAAAFYNQKLVVGLVTRESIEALAETIGIGFDHNKYALLFKYLDRAGIATAPTDFKPIKMGAMVLELTNKIIIDAIAKTATDYQQQLKECIDFALFYSTEPIGDHKDPILSEAPSSENSRATKTKPRKIETNNKPKFVPPSIPLKITRTAENTKQVMLFARLNAKHQIEGKLGAALHVNDFDAGVVAAINSAVKIMRDQTGVEMGFYMSSRTFVSCIWDVLECRFQINDSNEKYASGGEIFIDVQARIFNVAQLEFPNGFFEPIAAEFQADLKGVS